MLYLHRNAVSGNRNKEYCQISYLIFNNLVTQKRNALAPKRRGRRRRSNIHPAKMLLHIKKHLAFTSLYKATNDFLGEQEALGSWESRKEGRQEEMVTRRRLGQRSGIIISCLTNCLIKLFQRQGRRM